MKVLNIGLHQRALRLVGWIFAGMLALGTLLDAISNAISLVGMRTAVTASILVACCWAVAEVMIRKHPIVWRGVDGTEQRITKLGIQFRLFVVGMLALLWLPPLTDVLRQPTPKLVAPQAERTLPTESKNQQTKTAITREAARAENEPSAKIATPIKRVEQPATATRQSQAPIQTMINSPGGIQAGGNFTITSDRRVINAMTVRMSIETATLPATPGEPETSAGLQSIIGLFTKDKTRIRFATDYTFQEHQVTETRRRLTFTYTPEKAEEILGKSIEYLASIDGLAVNYAEILRMTKFDTTLAPSAITATIAINGITLATINRGAPAGRLSQGQAEFKVTDAFTQIPVNYNKAVERH